MTPPTHSFDDQPQRGSIPSDPLDPGPIARVNEGMKVVDASGEEIGKVAHLRMGDPEAVTTEGQETLDDGFRLFRVGDGPDLPESLRHQLARSGYIAIDRSGLFTGTAYARADQIRGVQNDRVMLAVRGDDLPTS
jgi:hypothetical protein